MAGRHISFCVVSLRPFWITRRPPLIFLMKNPTRSTGVGVWDLEVDSLSPSLRRALTSTPRFMRRVLTRAADRIATLTFDTLLQ